MEGEHKNINLPDDVLTDILVRAPSVESLMRFKIVSKHWFSLLTSTGFANLFQSRSNLVHSVFLIMPYYTNCWSGHLISIDPKLKPVTGTTHVPPQRFYKETLHKAATNTVNGLMCLYHHYERSISIYNLTTRENLRIPTLSETPRSSFSGRKCYLGFDPTTRKYKVFHIFLALDETVQCQVLTVGTDTWRTVNIHHQSSIHDARISHRGFCHNGVVYFEPCTQRGVFAFSVGTESLEYVRYSKEMLAGGKVLSVCQIGGQVSVVQGHALQNLVLWKLVDCRNGNSVWSREEIRFPFAGIESDNNVTCNENGLICQVRGCVRSLRCGDVIVDCYDIATSTRTVLRYSVKPSRSGLWLPDYYEFTPSVFEVNLIPLISVIAKVVTD